MIQYHNNIPTSEKFLIFHRSISNGGSSGAAVLGRDIRTVAHIDQNEVGLTDFAGLDLAGGYSVWVHYRSEDDPQIESYIKESKQSILAISERAGVLVDSSGLHTIRYDPVYRFTEQIRQVLI